MKRPNLKITKKIAATLLLATAAITANAQKLPSIQKQSIHAPGNVKTDGKPEEWDGFQAYNKSTNTYYTIANNADNLYLTIQATDPDAINKILKGGITFTVKSADKKSKVIPVTITYPIITAKPATGGGAGGGSMSAGGVTRVVRMSDGGSMAVTKANSTSIVGKLKDEGPFSPEDLVALNKQVNDNIKEIGISGIKEIPDSVISIYNDQGIKTAGLIDMKKAYTYELSVSLKYLQDVIGTSGSINYNIKLNGMNMKAMTVVINGHGADAGSPQVMSLVSMVSSGPGGGGTFQDLTSPTDFSGMYILAK